MKAAHKFAIVLSSALLAFFLIGLAYFLYDPGVLIYNILIAQLMVFSFAAISVLVFSIMQLLRRSRVATPGVSRIVLLTDMNAHKEEFSLSNRSSILIGKRETVYIRSEIDLALDGYAVINCVGNYWYVERIYDERSVGLKRAGEQFVYRLKTGISYKLHINDIIYIGNERLLVL